MTSANIDELKIVIEADDKASAKLASLITQLEALSKFSFNGMGDIGGDAEEAEKKLMGAYEVLERLTELAEEGSLGNFLEETDAVRVKLALLAKESHKLQSEGLNTDKAQKRMANISMEVGTLERKLARLEKAKALEELAKDAEKAKDAIADITAESEKTDRMDGMATTGMSEEIADATNEMVELDDETQQLLTDLGQFAHAVRISEIMDFAHSASEADLVRMKLQGIYSDIERIENKGGSATRIASLYTQAQKLEKQLVALENPVQKVVREVSKADAITFAKSLDAFGLLERKIESAYEKLRLLMSEGAKADAITAQVGTIKTLEAQKAKLLAERDKFWAGGRSNKQTEAMERFGKVVDKVKDKLKSLTKTASKGAFFPFVQVGSGIKNLTTGVGKLFTKLKTVATYRALRGFIKMINEGFKEGTNNAYQWSKALGDAGKTVNGRMVTFAGTMDRLATASLYLKNSFGAMATPLINALAPALDAIVDKIVTVLNAINMLVAKLTGASSWTKALRYPKEYAEAIDGATGSAGKLKDALVTILGIDEINPLNSAKDNKGSGGGGGGATDDFSQMFEEVALEAENAFNDFFKPFEEAWRNKGEGVVRSIENALTGISLLSQSVKESFWEVWTNGTGQETVEHLLGIFTGIMNTIGEIGKGLSEGWEFNDNGTRLVQGLWDILNDILRMWDEIANKTAEWASELDFRWLIEALADLAEGIEKVIEPLTRAVVWAWENIILDIGKWAIEKGLPKSLESLGTALGSIGDALTTLGNSKAGEVLGDLLRFLKDNALTTLDRKLQNLADMATVIAGIADILSGKKTLKMVWFELIEEHALRITTTLGYLSKAWEALMNLDFASVESNLRNALNPTNSPFYLKVKASIEEVDDNRKPPQKRLSFLAEVTGVDETPTTMPTGNSNFGLTTGGVRYALGGGGLPVTLGKINFGNTPSIEVEATAELVRIQDKLQAPMKQVHGMSAILETKNEKFNKTTGGMTANLASKAENFSKTTGGMTANLTSKKEGFSLVTAGMTAGLAFKKETFSTTTGGMTANLTSRTDNIPKAQRTVADVVATVTKLTKTANAKLELSGTLTGGGGGKAYLALKERGGILQNGFWRNIPQYAGGTLNAGSMFIAGESGAEIVANVNGRTEVLNQSQIAQAMASSMMQANATQNAILQEQNSLLRQLLAKDSTVTAVLSTSSLTDGVARKNRREGKTVIPVGV